MLTIVVVVVVVVVVPLLLLLFAIAPREKQLMIIETKLLRNGYNYIATASSAFLAHLIATH